MGETLLGRNLHRDLDPVGSGHQRIHIRLADHLALRCEVQQPCARVRLSRLHPVDQIKLGVAKAHRLGRVQRPTALPASEDHVELHDPFKARGQEVDLIQRPCEERAPHVHRGFQPLVGEGVGNVLDPSQDAEVLDLVLV